MKAKSKITAGLIVLIYFCFCMLHLTACKINEKNIDIERLDIENMKIEEIGETFIEKLFDISDVSYNYIINAMSYSDKEMKPFLTKASLTQLSRQLNEIHGEFLKIDSENTIQNDKDAIVSYICQGKETKYILHITFDNEKNIKDVDYEQLDAIDNFKLKKGEKIEIGKGDFKLPGILQYTEEVAPNKLVLIMPDSGITDIDGTVGALKPYEDISSGLVNEGFAVYRFEKRTYYYKAMTDMTKITPYEEIEDMLEAIRYFKNNADYNFDKIYVIGHGFGGYLLPELYTYLTDEEKEVINGFIYMAPSASKIEEYLANAESKYYEYLIDYDPVKSAQNIKDIKMIFLFGENDKSISLDEYNIWKSNMSDIADIKLFSKANRYFMNGTGDSSDLTKPANIKEEVINFIAEFLNKN